MTPAPKCSVAVEAPVPLYRPIGSERRGAGRSFATRRRSGRRERAVSEFAPKRRARVLVISGGRLGTASGPVAQSPRIDLVETDVYLGAPCDGGLLRRASSSVPRESFDGVVAQVVPAHALTRRAVSEIHRASSRRPCLRRDTVHAAGPRGCLRLHTVDRNRRSTAFPDARRAGRRSRRRTGHGAPLGVVLPRPKPSVPARQAGRQTRPAHPARLRLLKHLDRALIDHPGATDAASCVYFMGIKAETPVPDAEVVAGYAGANARPVRERRARARWTSARSPRGPTPRRSPRSSGRAVRHQPRPQSPRAEGPSRPPRGPRRAAAYRPGPTSWTVRGRAAAAGAPHGSAPRAPAGPVHPGSDSREHLPLGRGRRSPRVVVAQRHRLKTG